jgi:glycosyltransferase involved in cell wall biosynthesis
MKILVLEPNPSFGGGSEGIALALSQEMAKRGHQIVLVHETEGSMLPHYRAIACRTIREPLPPLSVRRPFGAMRTAIRLRRILLENALDVLFSSHLGFVGLGAILRRIARVPSCFHLGLGRSAPSLVDRLVFRGASAGVAPSEHTKETWRRSGWPVKTLHVVQNWVDAERFHPIADRNSLRADLGIPLESPCVTYVGRICEEKGIDDLVTAFQLLRSRHSQASLVLVGSAAPDYEKRLQGKLEALELCDRGAVLRFAATPSPEKHFAAADLVCMPSRWEEPFGLAALEGMACGNPVVVTNVGVLSDLVGGPGSGLVVPAGDAQALSSRLDWWLSHRERSREKGAVLRERVKVEFGPASSVDRYEAILSSAVAESTRP